MDGALLIARLVLALVFVVAAATKLADRPGTRQAIIDFGAPRIFARPISLLLPLAELIVAIALIPAGSAWVASLGALVLLGIFIVAVGANLALGRKVNCNCFGQVSSGPISWRTLVRNAVFSVVALFIAIKGYTYGGMNVTDWLGGLSTSDRVGLGLVIVLGALLIGQWGFLFNLLQQNGRLLQRLDDLERRIADGATSTAQQSQAAPQPVYGLPINSAAPDFSLSGMYGETMTRDALLARGKDLLLVFTDPNCGPCGELLPDLGRWQSDFADSLTIALISRGSVEANRAKAGEHGIQTVLLQKDQEVAQLYSYPGTPSALIVGSNGTIQTSTSAGPEHIRAMVASAMGTAERHSSGAVIPLLDEAPTAVPPSNGNGNSAPATPALGVGDAVPSIKLKDLNSKTMDLAELRGRKTLLVFWNTGCGFCQQMLPDLKEWERNKTQDDPDLVLVSAGSLEDNRSMALRSTVLLDSAFQTAQQFGAQGTPMAVIIDEDGKIASGVAAGAPQVFALAAGSEDAMLSTSTPAAAATVGTELPSVPLKDLEGRDVNVAEMRGSDKLLLFWNTGCGFCQQLLPELKEWETQRPADAPDVIVISASSVDESRAMGLTSAVLIDPDFRLGSTVGANGTPMGVLVDREGKIASEVAAGGPAVMELARTGGAARSV